MTKQFNIELKFGNRKKCDSDFEKLIREKPTGVWFQILKNTDRGTLPSVAGKIEEALEKALPLSLHPEKKIIFAFCVLEKKEHYVFSVEFKKSEDVRTTLNNSEDWKRFTGKA